MSRRTSIYLVHGIALILLLTLGCGCSLFCKDNFEGSIRTSRREIRERYNPPEAIKMLSQIAEIQDDVCKRLDAAEKLPLDDKARDAACDQCAGMLLDAMRISERGVLWAKSHDTRATPKLFIGVHQRIEASWAMTAARTLDKKLLAQIAGDLTITNIIIRCLQIPTLTDFWDLSPSAEDD